MSSRIHLGRVTGIQTSYYTSKNCKPQQDSIRVILNIYMLAIVGLMGPTSGYRYRLCRYCSCKNFQDHEGNKLLGEGPESSFDWLDENRPENFEGPTTAQKEMDRHIKLQHMMNANRVKNNPIKPVLVVSASNQPNDAPSQKNQ